MILPLRRSISAEGGVVDQDIHGDAFALELVKEEFGCRGNRQIKREGFDGYTVGLEFDGDAIEFVSAASDQNQVVTVASEEFGEFVSDAAGCAGDEDSHGDILTGCAWVGR
jgi:hypothetical protein